MLSGHNQSLLYIDITRNDSPVWGLSVQSTFFFFFLRPGFPFETVLFQKKSYKAVSQVIDTATSILGHLSKTKTI